MDLHPLPRFTERIIEEHGDKKICIDELGAKCIVHKNPATPGFVTRSWLEFPVKTRADFAELKKRLLPNTPGRFPADWDRSVADAGQRDYVLYAGITGPWHRVRSSWVGFENLCMLVMDDPAFVHEMMEFNTDFTIETIKDRISDVELDFVFIYEDMAYKTASMISPDMVRQFLVPEWKKLIEFLRKNNVAHVVMDSDGHVRELIPIWIDAGFTGMFPVEIAANNDPVAYRSRYGSAFTMFGGIDKRELRFDPERVKREVLSKVPYLVRDGGYVPGVDHGVPPDIPLKNFLYMAELIKASCEGRDPSEVTTERYDKILGPMREQWSIELAERIAEHNVP